jgi:gas vesicle protein
MNNNNIGGFLLGLSLGGAIALLFAPREGKKTRAQLAQAAADKVSYMKDCGETVRDTTRELYERGKDEVARQKEGVTEAIRQGAEAYQHAVR